MNRSKNTNPVLLDKIRLLKAEFQKNPDTNEKDRNYLFYTRGLYCIVQKKTPFQTSSI